MVFLSLDNVQCSWGPVPIWRVLVLREMILLGSIIVPSTHKLHSVQVEDLRHHTECENQAVFFSLWPHQVLVLFWDGVILTELMMGTWQLDWSWHIKCFISLSVVQIHTKLVVTQICSLKTAHLPTRNELEAVIKHTISLVSAQKPGWAHRHKSIYLSAVAFSWKGVSKGQSRNSYRVSVSFHDCTENFSLHVTPYIFHQC